MVNILHQLAANFDQIHLFDSADQCETLIAVNTCLAQHPKLLKLHRDAIQSKTYQVTIYASRKTLRSEEEQLEANKGQRVGQAYILLA